MNKNMFTKLTLISSLALVGEASAEFNLTTNFEPKNDTKKESILTGSFGVTTNHLVENVGDVIGNGHYGELNLKYQSFDGRTYKGLDIESRVNSEEQMMYSVKESVIEYRYSKSRFAIGRTNLEWSKADAIWGLGKINNRRNFDYFEPGQEGLIGLFYDKKYDGGLNIGLFGSFVYVPELNPGQEINKKNGTVTCKNAWCKAPSPTAPVEGRNVPIFYNVNYPEVSDVVLRYSAGIRLGWDYKNIKLNGFYLKKPENNISVTAEVKYETDNQRIFVDATPQFYYHDVTGANAEIVINDYFSIYGAAISSIPNKSPENDEPFIEYTGIKPIKKKEEYLSGGLQYDDGNFKSHLGYIARISEFDKENDILVEYPRWNQALHFAVSKNLTRKLFVGLDYKYDMLTEDRLTMVKTSYSFGPSVVASLGVNIIGTDSSQESYWSDFENNDAVYGSLKYIF